MMADGIRAEVAYRQQRYDEALRLLSKPRVAPNYRVAGSSPLMAGARERFRRAELLARAGQNEDALRWYSSFDIISMFEAPMLAPSLLRRAEIYEKLGRKPDAIKAYQGFLELWLDADPDLQPIVTHHTVVERVNLDRLREEMKRLSPADSRRCVRAVTRLKPAPAQFEAKRGA